MLAIQSSNESVSMLVTNMSASFGKKATERSTFLCVDGLQVFEAIDHTIKTGEGVTVDMHSWHDAKRRTSFRIYIRSFKNGLKVLRIV